MVYQKNPHKHDNFWVRKSNWYVFQISCWYRWKFTYTPYLGYIYIYLTSRNLSSTCRPQRGSRSQSSPSTWLSWNPIDSPWGFTGFTTRSFQHLGMGQVTNSSPVHIQPAGICGCSFPLKNPKHIVVLYLYIVFIGIDPWPCVTRLEFSKNAALPFS